MWASKLKRQIDNAHACSLIYAVLLLLPLRQRSFDKRVTVLPTRHLIQCTRICGILLVALGLTAEAEDIDKYPVIIPSDRKLARYTNKVSQVV